MDYASNSLLNARLSLRKRSTADEIDIYEVDLKFCDLLQRDRNHLLNIELQKGLHLKPRCSFTAVSHIDPHIGIVKDIDRNNILVLDSNNNFLQIQRFGDYDVSVEDAVVFFDKVVIDKICGLQQKYVLMPETKVIDKSLLRLQSINVDLIDDSGAIIHRTMIDPILRGGIYGSRMVG